MRGGAFLILNLTAESKKVSKWRSYRKGGMCSCCLHDAWVCGKKIIPAFPNGPLWSLVCRPLAYTLTLINMQFVDARGKFTSNPSKYLSRTPDIGHCQPQRLHSVIQITEQISDQRAKINSFLSNLNPNLQQKVA